MVEEPSAFVNTRNSASVPVEMVQCYISARHKDWKEMCTTGACIGYNITAKDPSMQWEYQEGIKQIQVKVLGHLYIKTNGVRFS